MDISQSYAAATVTHTNNSWQQTWRSRIRALWYNYERNQQEATLWVNLFFPVSSTRFGRKHHPKHVELTGNNKLTYIVASCCLLS